MRYAWAPDRHSGLFTKVEPDLVGQQIEALAKEYGVCSPRMLVETARPKKSPIHNLFEWNDVLAAEKWRIEQGRAVVQTLRIVSRDGEIDDSPAFVHVRIVTEDGVSEGYKPSIHMATDEEMAGFVLAEALAQLNSLRRRYGRLRKLGKVWAALDEVQEKQTV